MSSSGAGLRQTAPNQTKAKQYEAFQRKRDDYLTAQEDELQRKKGNVIAAAAQSASCKGKERTTSPEENRNGLSAPPLYSSGNTSSSSTSAASIAFSKKSLQDTKTDDSSQRKSDVSDESTTVRSAIAAAGGANVTNGSRVVSDEDKLHQRQIKSPDPSLAAAKKSIVVNNDMHPSTESGLHQQPPNAVKAAQKSTSAPLAKPEEAASTSENNALKAAQKSVVSKKASSQSLRIDSSSNIDESNNNGEPVKLLSPVPRRFPIPGFLDNHRREEGSGLLSRELRPSTTEPSEKLRSSSAAMIASLFKNQQQPQHQSIDHDDSDDSGRRSLDEVRPEVRAALKAGKETISPEAAKLPKQSRMKQNALDPTNGLHRFIHKYSSSYHLPISTNDSNHHHSHHREHSPQPRAGTTVIRTTMRKEGKHSRFNEDKPWKHHVHTNRVGDDEKKRYEGLWATNKGIHYKYLFRYDYGYETDDECDNDGSDYDDDDIYDSEVHKDYVHGLVVRELWRRSRLPEDVLEKIWNLVDRKRIGALDREEFLIGTWLVDQCLYGRKLPRTVDSKLWNSVSKLNVKINIRKHMHGKKHKRHKDKHSYDHKHAH